jgi:hypothetical protein
LEEGARQERRTIESDGLFKDLIFFCSPFRCVDRLLIQSHLRMEEREEEGK